MKMKTLASAVTLGAALTFSSLASANGGLYAMASLDWVDSSAELTSDDLSQEGLSLTGVGGTLRFGYEFPLPGGYVGVEGNIAESGAEYNERMTGAAVSATKDFGYGVSVLAGTNINRSSTLYGLLGYQMTNFEMSAQVDGLGTQTNDETFGGVRVGLGLKSDITEALALRLEWTRTFYGEETFDFDELGGTPLDLDINESLFSIGIQARF